MNKQCIHFSVAIICLLVFSSQMLAQQTTLPKREVNYTTVKMTPQEVNAILNQGESPQLNRQIVAEGYEAASTVTATKYVGTDSVGAFEIIVIEQSYRTSDKKKSEIGTHYYQAKRGNTILKTRQVAFDNNTEYQAGKLKLQVVPVAPVAQGTNALSACFSKFIVSWSSCSAAGNSIKSCINGCPKNNKKKPKFGCAVGCVLSNAKQFKSCITNVVALTNCVIDNW